MNFYSVGFLLLITLLAATAQAEQTCRSNLEISTPTSRFVINENGTVTDKETEITWMRCAVGQTWDGQQCSGEPNIYTWQEAAREVNKLNKHGYGDYKGWRLPFVPELASIVERQCFQPRINLAVFPETPSLVFWTGMERMGHPDMAYALDFGGGAATPRKKSFKGTIRLMHDGPNGPWWEPPKMPGYTDKP